MNAKVSGSRIVYERWKKHISQVALATYLRLDPATLRKIESGERIPDAETRKKLDFLFGTGKFDDCWGETDGR